MKLQKYIASILILAMLMVVFVGCENKEEFYDFRQDLENVEKVSIFANDPETDTRTLITDLEKGNGKELTNILATMKCRKYFPGDHPRYYGLLIIALTYTDGEIELIGLYNIGWVTPDGVEYLTSCYFDDKEVYDLICRFVDPEMLPDMSEEYPQWFS